MPIIPILANQILKGEIKDELPKLLIKDMAKQGERETDAGGVSARIGFKYQDHAAAQFVIMMLQGNIREVQCETSDDIQVEHENNLGEIYTEFIQVKTTEGDSKWKITELCKRNPVKSLYENSFGFDDGKLQTCFRIITKRDVEKKLRYLTFEKDIRAVSEGLQLQKSIERQSKKFKSPKGREAEYWIANTLWQVAGNMDDLQAKNQKAFLQLAEMSGWAMNHSDVEQIYDDILKMVDHAASASKITHSHKKSIKRNEINLWWADKLSIARNNALGNAKPYVSQVESFLVEFHSVSETTLMRGLTGLDAGYDNKKWRWKELASHLVEWLPEIALKASSLASMKHHNAGQLFATAISKVSSRLKASGEEVVGEILLHICIRQVFKSEPIACKLFYLAGLGEKLCERPYCKKR